MITAEQIRAARALLKWSAQELADKAGISWRTVQRLESGSGTPSSLIQTLGNIRRTLESAGVVFIDENGGGPGVRLKRRL